MKSNKSIALAFGMLLTATHAYGIDGSVARYYQEDGPILVALKAMDLDKAREELENYKNDPRTMMRPGGQNRVGKHDKKIKHLQSLIDRAENEAAETDDVEEPTEVETIEAENVEVPEEVEAAEEQEAAVEVEAAEETSDAEVSAEVEQEQI